MQQSEEKPENMTDCAQYFSPSQEESWKSHQGLKQNVGGIVTPIVVTDKND